MKDPRTATNWDFLNPKDKELWLHGYHAYLGKGVPK